MIKKLFRLSSVDFEALKLKRPVKTLKNLYFTAKIYENQKKTAKIGVVVSKAVDNRSSVRNRLKRAIFDGFGAIIHTLKSADYVIILNKAAAKAEKTQLLSEISKLSTASEHSSGFPTLNPKP